MSGRSHVDPQSILTELLDIVYYKTKKPLRPNQSSGVLEDDSIFNVENYGGFLTKEHINNLKVSLNSRFVVVDGSSRAFSTPYFKLFMAGVAVYGTDPLHVYPSYLIGKSLNVDWGFAGIKVDDEDVLNEVEENERLNRFVRTKSVEEMPLNNYDDASVDDDIRMSLEAKVIESLGKNGLLKSEDVLVLDGPIYLATLSRHRQKLAQFRINAIEKVEEIGRGIPVVGVVKRVENSRKLCNDEVKNLINGFITDRRQIPQDRVDLLLNINNNACNDAAMMSWLGEILRVGYGEALILGPLKISSGKAKSVSDFVDRVFWYVYTRLGSGVFRIETLDTIYERHKDLIDKVVKWLVKYIDDRGLPYIIDAADYYAKEITRGMYVALYSYSKSRGMNLDYETIIKAFEMMHEVYLGKTQI